MKYTISHDPDHRHVGKAPGAVGILEKSFSADELLAAVEHALQKEKSGRRG